MSEETGVKTNGRVSAEDYLGRWRVIAGSMRGQAGDLAEHYALLRPGEQPGQLDLCLEIGGAEPEFLQTLRFMEDTGSLENREAEKPDRCLVLWQRHAPRRLFAMRVKSGQAADLYPWEKLDDNGTWGAEEEPPPGGQRRR